MVRRAVLDTPENGVPAPQLLFLSLQGSAAGGSQNDGAGNLAVNQPSESSAEHSADARARVGDIAESSIARGAGSAVAAAARRRTPAVGISGNATFRSAALLNI